MAQDHREGTRTSRSRIEKPLSDAARSCRADIGEGLRLVRCVRLPVVHARLEEQVQPEELVDVAIVDGLADLSLSELQAGKRILGLGLAANVHRLGVAPLESEGEEGVGVHAVGVMVNTFEIDHRGHRNDAELAGSRIDEVHWKQVAAGYERQRAE